VNRTHLKGRLFAAGLKQNRCERCGIEDWLGDPLAMALHHVNGDGRDNRLAALRALAAHADVLLERRRVVAGVLHL
jgi:hypothetical protein